MTNAAKKYIRYIEQNLPPLSHMPDMIIVVDSSHHYHNRHHDHFKTEAAISR